MSDFTAPPMKLTYFNIAGVAEKIRLAFALKGLKYEDERVNFADWQTKIKPTTKFGQLPMFDLGDGKGYSVAQSDAILRYVCALPGAVELMPADPAASLRVNEAVGLVGDLDRDWSSKLYISMMPENYGYPAEFKDTDEHKVK
jgi:glutathione S-transferase